MSIFRLSQTIRINRGSTRAFDALYAEYGARILNYLRLMTGSHSEAEDLTQETFLAAYQSCHSYRGKSQPLAWLVGIARRRWRDGTRARRVSTESFADDLPTEDIAVNVVRTAHLRCCLSKIEPTAREAVLLILGEGLTYAEAAEILGEPVGTVKWRVHQATRALRTLLAEEEDLG